jgi:hypothetical protein
VGVAGQGLVQFTPRRLWVVRDGIHWACLAPQVWLDYAGCFTVQVTATDNDAISWDYEIRTPAGTFRVPIPWSEAGWSLRELIDEHHPGPRPPHRR